MSSAPGLRSLNLPLLTPSANIDTRAVTIPFALPLSAAEEQKYSDPAALGPITQYVELEIEARSCETADKLRFAIVNATRKLIAFDLAFLVEPGQIDGWTITRASSVSKVDRSASLPRAIEEWLAHPKHAELMKKGEARRVALNEDAKAWQLRGEPFLQPHAIWLPIKGRTGRVLAAFIALRKEPWLAQDLALLVPLAGAYGHAFEALLPSGDTTMNRAKKYMSKRAIALASTAAISLAMFLPTTLSALAPAEIVASAPVLVTAPLDGVVGEITAQPGTWVEKETVIVRFVDVKQRNDYEVANRNTAVAEARYFKNVQTATANQKDMEELSIAKAELDVATAEFEFAEEMLERSEIKAAKSGVLIYSAKSDWIGKPVSTGERLMEIGDPAKSEIRIELPVSDALALEEGGPVQLFLDGDPLRPISGSINRISYRPVLSAEQLLVFRVFAKFDSSEIHRIGNRGIARVNGTKVPVWFYLLRRPIAAVRQWLGR